MGPLLRLALLFSLLLSASACRSNSRTAEQGKAPATAPATLPIPEDRSADDTARFLAGINGKPGSPFADMERDPAWIGHSLQFEIGWAKFARDRLPAMREFVRSELAGEPVAQPVLFYPFGGPDILTAQTFFPAAATYILVGLEPPGTLPPVKMFQGKPLKQVLPRLRGTLGSVLNKSFFITAEMDAQLRGQVTDGLLPVMLVQLVRFGNTVRGLRYIGLDEEGRWIDRKPDPTVRGKADGIAVEFDDAAGGRHTLLYFSVNLMSDRLKNNVAFLKFLDRQANLSSFFKSTSYMPHKAEFELIRSEVLRRSSAVIQDDSGIPYKHYQPGQWQVRLFGDYDKPYGSFRWLQQRDLKAAFQRKSEVGKLGFSIGYGFGRVKSNLIVARKKSASS